MTVQENGTYGGRRQSRWLRTRRRLCCLNFNLFVLAVTSGNIDPRSDLGASDSKGRWSIVPHSAKRRKLRPRHSPICRGFFFGAPRFQNLEDTLIEDGDASVVPLGMVWDGTPTLNGPPFAAALIRRKSSLPIRQGGPNHWVACGCN